MIPPYIIDNGQAGTWRAALNPNARCAGCGQSICPCPDLVYQGLLNPSKGGADSDARAFTPVSLSLHSPTDMQERQHDHGA